MRAEAQERLSGAVVAQGRGDALLVEVLGDVFQRACGVLNGRDGRGVDALGVGAEEGEALRLPNRRAGGL
jgi:hypothetical protein